MSTTTTNATLVSSETQQAALSVHGMDCASCVAHVQKAAGSVVGVQSIKVSLARGRAVLEFDPAKTSPAIVAAIITKVGYPSEPEGDVTALQAEENRTTSFKVDLAKWKRRTIIGVSLWLPVELLHWILLAMRSHQLHSAMNWLALGSSTLAMFLVGGGFYQGAWKGLKQRTTNMDTLIALGATVAYGYSLIAFGGYQMHFWKVLPDLYFMEAAGLLGLISLGHFMEARSRNMAGSAIAKLLQLTPATAWRMTDNEVESVAAAALNIGDRILIKPGEQVPTDGIVIEGISEIDESMITGEAMPATRKLGDEVIGGTLNQNGRLIIRATKVGSDTSIAQIVRLVENAQSSKPPVQQLADRIAAYFVPIVLLIAMATGIGWYFYGVQHQWDSPHIAAMIAKCVCSVLIIACPCALGLALPAALMVGTGLGAKHGILFRDIDALQNAERIDTIVLDKTGTLTTAKPTLQEILALPEENIMTGDVVKPPNDALLQLAASAEQFSEHPLARAIVLAASEKNLKLTTPTTFSNDPGYGVSATINGRQTLVGTADLLKKHGCEITRMADTAKKVVGSVVYVAQKTNDRWRETGSLHFADTLRTEAIAAIDELRGFKLHIILLTGDNPAAAQAVAAKVGIQEIHAQVKPAEKADVIANLQAAGKVVAMVGDGINDAPALAKANLGIAIGSGTDIAKESGGIILISGNLSGIASALRLSRATMKTIRRNLFLAFIYNVLAIPPAAFGMLNPLIAAGAMALSDLTVIGSALLLRNTPIETPKDR